MKNRVFIKHREGNITPLLCEVIKNLPENCKNIIEFEKGTYYFEKDGSDAYPIFASSGSLCDGRNGNVLFPIINQKHITIEGNGSDFLICDRLQPFMVQNSHDVTFKNFTLDYAFLRYAYADVVSVTGEGIELFIDEKLAEYEVKDGCINFICGKEKLSTKDRKISFKQMTPGKGGICFIYAGDVNCELNRAAKNVFVDAEKSDKGVFLRYRPGTTDVGFGIAPKDRICLAYDNDREYQMFWIDNSEKVKFENISVYRNGGMGIVADGCKDILIDKLNFSIKPGRDEYYTSTADAMFITNCRGKFILKNSTVCDTYDDAINIHGYYKKVKEVLGDNKIKLSIIHPAHIGVVPYKKGDRLLFNDTESGKVLFSSFVKKAEYDKDRNEMVVTLSDATKAAEGMTVENISAMPEVIIENNNISNCPHMRLSAPYMIIRNNKLNLNNADIYISDLWGFWSEYGRTLKTVISGNTFNNAGDASIKIGSERPLGHNRNNGKVIIKNNRFFKSKENAIKASSVDKVILKNNEFGVAYD